MAVAVEDRLGEIELSSPRLPTRGWPKRVFSPTLGHRDAEGSRLLTSGLPELAFWAGGSHVQGPAGYVRQMKKRVRSGEWCSRLVG